MPGQDDNSSSNDIARLRYRCRRGMLELDALLARFIGSTGFLQLNDGQRTTFAQLLEEPDPQLYRWLIGSEPCDSLHYRALLEAIRAG